jgi:hypothetical protein
MESARRCGLEPAAALWQTAAMQQLSKLIICLLAGFALGFGAEGIVNIGFQKMRTAEILGEAVAQLRHLDDETLAFQAVHGRFPRDAAEMAAAGLWKASDPPVERLRGGAQWVAAFDGEGGFVYASATGKVYLNVDLRNEKLRAADAAEVRAGGIVPDGTY